MPLTFLSVLTGARCSRSALRLTPYPARDPRPLSYFHHSKCPSTPGATSPRPTLRVPYGQAQVPVAVRARQLAGAVQNRHGRRRALGEGQLPAAPRPAANVPVQGQRRCRAGALNLCSMPRALACPCPALLQTAQWRHVEFCQVLPAQESCLLLVSSRVWQHACASFAATPACTLRRHPSIHATYSPRDAPYACNPACTLRRQVQRVRARGPCSPAW